jgi:hypothetical protein
VARVRASDRACDCMESECWINAVCVCVSRLFVVRMCVLLVLCDVRCAWTHAMQQLLLLLLLRLLQPMHSNATQCRR